MKKIILTLTVLLFACDNGVVVINKYDDPLCQFYYTLTVPDQFELNKIGEARFPGSIVEFQFVTDAIGYILGSTTAGGFVMILKTEDGGRTWNDLGIEINYRQHPWNVFFKNENLGFITVHDVTGCPDDCEYRAVLLKTDNGGLTWEEIVYPELRGSFYHLVFDEHGNVYAMLSSLLDIPDALMKSSDKGATWNELYSSDDMEFKSIHFSFKLFDDKLYISGRDGKLIKIDTYGNLIDVIHTNQPYISDLRIIDENVLFIKGREGLLRSIDGGKSWTYIFKGRHQIIDFISANEGLVVLNEGVCPSWSYISSDVIAYTNDGGETWSKGDYITNLISRFSGHKKSGNDYYLMFGKTLVIIRKIQD